MEGILESLKGTGQINIEKDYSSDKVRILVAGIGGGGCNTITRITRMGISSADTVAINTDQNHLKIVESQKRLLIGERITRGLGAGGVPEVAMKCAEASKSKIKDIMGQAELVFLCAGEGGGTGTGASPIVAQLAKEQGAIVVGMVTFPFALERVRLDKAKWGIEQLSKVADTTVIIDNNRLLQYCPNLPMDQAFKVADEIVARAVKGISDTIMFPSLINIDYADVRSIMTGGGAATISVGEGHGSQKVEQAIRSTLEHPLLDVDYAGAKGALLHIAGGPELTLSEATKIGEGITDVFSDEANIIWGSRILPELGDKVVVTAVMTGVTSTQLIGHPEQKKQEVAMMDVEDLTYI